MLFQQNKYTNTSRPSSSIFDFIRDGIGVEDFHNKTLKKK